MTPYFVPHGDDQPFSYSPGIVPYRIDRLKVNKVFGAEFFCQQNHICLLRRFARVLRLDNPLGLRLCTFGSPGRQPNLETTMPLNSSLHHPRMVTKPSAEAVDRPLLRQECVRILKGIVQCQPVVLIDEVRNFVSLF